MKLISEHEEEKRIINRVLSICIANNNSKTLPDRRSPIFIQAMLNPRIYTYVVHTMSPIAYV